ncbi:MULTISPECIES: serine/threonine protein kinase [unclassified Streptomyces]|uniref:serine/threonine protein kinase n=1 Tax=unclassified Streptomyces TaxID=2593676 RepID=UPI000DAC55BE|nr:MULTISPECIES: serine/threonine protein kinase [unclassified Streptomyces]PZT76914.1 serine/threonine protein kinase [Streptomyces sp. AC1-42W]PZT79130.1 serine/threonine protein kinase [Streptomyces sp. AC1-42T]
MRIPCPHRRFTGAPCDGAVLPTGHCDTCGRDETAPGLPPLPAAPEDHGPAGLLELPLLDPGSPAERLAAAEQPVRVVMTCSAKACGTAFVPPHTAAPPPDEGYCPVCGAPYSYRPELTRDGPPLQDQYRIRGPIAHGGQGWVYLAEDTHLEDFVAVKGLLNRYAERGAAQAGEERRSLVAIRHERIVQIRDFVSTTNEDGTVSGGYIVMEDVGDRTLSAVVESVRRGTFVLDIEHVLTYGCQMLEALSHLHGMGFLYGDMKPSNVIHHLDGIKVIDLGGVRKAGSADPPPVITPYFAAPETDGTQPLTVAHDVHTVGVTLAELARWAVGDDVPGLGISSFRLAVARATAEDPEQRFGTADDMAGQLRGVLREIRALRGKRDQPEPSAHFTPSAELLGARLGSVPDYAQWLRRPPHRRRDAPPAPALDPGTPTPTEIARRLPVPRPYPGDPQAARFGVSSYDPAQPLAQPATGERSVEICLHNARLLLGQEGGEALAAAHEQVEAAAAIPGPGPVRQWRLGWHRGLVALRGADVRPEERAELLAAAHHHFAAVHRALPGEYAAKLALAYSAEQLGPAGGPSPGPSAYELFRAVHARNPSHVGAALGLARLALARGDRAAAVAVLDLVPDESRDHTVARVAALRIRAARLAAGEHPLPGEAEIDAALAGLGPVAAGDEAAWLLRTELYEWKLDAVRAAGVPAPRRTWPRRGLPPPPVPGERAVRAELEQCYRWLARQRLRPEEHEHLIDLSHAVRPQTRF